MFNFLKKTYESEPVSSNVVEVPLKPVGGGVRTEVVSINDLVQPRVASMNFMTMYFTIPEVFFPIDYIASRIAGAKFVLKRDKDDSVVWHNAPVNTMLATPNCLQTWSEMVYQHFVYKLCTGTSFIRAAQAESLGDISFRKCSNYWVLPSDRTDIVGLYGKLPIYGIAEKEEIIKEFVLHGGLDMLHIPTPQVYIDRDKIMSVFTAGNYFRNDCFLKSNSRLMSCLKNISNLLAVYDARNIIYVKRGGLGFLVSQKKDATGSDALTEEEKRNLLQQNFSKYGVSADQVPYGISDVDVRFERINLSIADMQPFDETLADAINIAGAYGIPAVLVPRKDQATFANQATAEKTVYSSVVIPMCEEFCAALTHFLGLDEAKLYLDCDFSNVDCLQVGLKEQESVKKMINDRCFDQFNCGLITLNDWRAQIGEAQIEEEVNPIFSKLKFDMSDEELAVIDKIIKTTNKTPSEDEETVPKPSVQD
jgi:hypothetical protein